MFLFACMCILSSELNYADQHDQSLGRCPGFPCLLESLDFFLKFPGPAKSWNLSVGQVNQHAFCIWNTMCKQVYEVFVLCAN